MRERLREKRLQYKRSIWSADTYEIHLSCHSSSSRASMYSYIYSYI